MCVAPDVVSWQGTRDLQGVQTSAWGPATTSPLPEQAQARLRVALRAAQDSQTRNVTDVYYSRIDCHEWDFVAL